MTAEKKITPVLKLTRTRTEEYEICPHCNKEIMEKSSYIDPDNYVYHRPCMDKGPIEKIIPCLPPGWGDGSAIASALEAIAGKTEPEADKPKKVSITREQWLKAGEKAGWLKEADAEVIGLGSRVKGEFMHMIDELGAEYEFSYEVHLEDDPSRGPDRVEDLEPTGYPKPLPEDWLDNNWDELADIAFQKAQDVAYGPKEPAKPAPPKEPTDEERIERAVEETLKESPRQPFEEADTDVIASLGTRMRSIG